MMMHQRDSQQSDVQANVQANVRANVLTAEDIARFHRDGIIIVRGVFDLDELEPIRNLTRAQLEAVQTFVRDGGGRTYKVAIWTNLDDSLLGKLPRIPRVVNAVEALLGETCYHWHSKLLRKQPDDGAVGIHQDYATWYEDGCLAPNMLTCTIAIDANSRENGCVYFVPGSHKMARFHRVRLGDTIDTHGPDPARVQRVVERHGLVYPELQPGDCLFFHCNMLHGSEPNRSDRARTVVHCSYNSESNQPIALPGQDHHRYHPLVQVSDSYLRERDFGAIFHADTLHQRETDDSAGAGIFFRNSDSDVATGA